MKKALSFVVVLAVLALGVFGYVRYYYVFGEGVKTGTLNYVVYKGMIFKTYEGKLIQSGLRAGAAGAIQSYEFEFSIEDPAIAEQLMLEGGENVELHYKEYFAPLPWRGYTKYIVDQIIAVDGRRIEPVNTAKSSTESAESAPAAEEEAVVESDESVEQTI
jgi:hypothetical protein